MITIDGSKGEGGGQLLRSALSLSAITQTPVRIQKIRANRANPGLARQHLCALRAMGEICGAKVKGDELRSSEVEFHPGPVRAGNYRFAVGTAGSAGLVLQTVLWPLLLAGQETSQLRIEGGTHNHKAPSFEFLAHSFVPQVQAMGATLQVFLERYGFYPAGGGVINAVIEPSQLRASDIGPRGALLETKAEVICAHLPPGIARRELRAVVEHMDWSGKKGRSLEVESDGPGNAVVLRARFEQGSIVTTAIGRRGVRAEQVGKEAAQEMARALALGPCVDEHLADQLLLPLALGVGGSFVTSRLSEHCTSNAQLIERFLPVKIRFSKRAQGDAKVVVTPLSS